MNVDVAQNTSVSAMPLFETNDILDLNPKVMFGFSHAAHVLREKSCGAQH